MRPPWESLPAQVRHALEGLLGFPVVEALSQHEGFSPGVAAAVRGPSGERAFVKAVSSQANARTPDLHRAEAVATRLLPPELGSPRLLGMYDEGTWVALALEHVDGRVPERPWVAADLDAAVAVLDRLAQVAAPAGLAAAGDGLREDFGGWARLADSDVSLCRWEQQHLDQLVALESDWPAAVAGDRLLHLDARADNMLVRPDGTAVLVDWPWACAGAPVMDVIGFVPDAVLRGAPAADELLLRTTAGRKASTEQVDVLVCAFAGLMAAAHRRPVEPGMERVRVAQREQWQVALAWLRTRTGWS